MVPVKIRWPFLAVGGGVLAAGFAGCSRTPGFNSPDPSMRERAIVGAAESTDPGDYPKLVQKLDDDDANTRMLAILVLKQRTGTTRGYDFAAPRAERAPSVKEWQQWAEQFVEVQGPSPSSGSGRSLNPENPG